MKTRLLIISKKVNTGNVRFTTYFAYVLTNDKDKDGYYKEMTRRVKDSVTHEDIDIPISLKVVPLGAFKDILTTSTDFPYTCVVDDKAIDKDTGKKTFSIGVDKDRATNQPRLDKRGNKHYVAFISHVEELEHYETRGLSIEDIR